MSLIAALMGSSPQIAGGVWSVSTNKSGAAVLQLPISLVANAEADTTVTLTVTGTARNADQLGTTYKDYTLSATSVVIPAGAKVPVTAVTVTIINNPLYFIAKSLNIVLSAPGNPTFVYPTVAITINDDVNPQTLDITNPGNGLSACDNTYADDATANLNAILQWISDNGGGVAYAPAGTYKLMSTQYLDVNFPCDNAQVSLIGASRTTSIFKRAVVTPAPSDCIFTMTDYPYSSAAYAGVVDSAIGTTVTDSDKSFASTLIGKRVYNVTAAGTTLELGGLCSGLITAVEVNTFTAELTGGTRQTWEADDVYHIAVDSVPFHVAHLQINGNGGNQSWASEYAGLFGANGSGNYPGKGTLCLDTLHLIDAGGSNYEGDGVRIESNINLISYDLYGERCGRGTLCFTGGRVNARVNGVSTNGTGTCLQNEADPSTGYGYLPYYNSHPAHVAHAPMDIDFYNVSATGHSTIEDMSRQGSYSKSYYNNLQVINPDSQSLAAIFANYETGETEHVNSIFEGGSDDGNYNFTAEFISTLTTITGCSFNGVLRGTAHTGSAYMCAYLPRLVPVGETVFPYDAVFTNCTFNAQSDVVAAGFAHRMGVCHVDSCDPGTSHILTSCTFGANLTDAVGLVRALEMHDCIHNQSGFILYTWVGELSGNWTFEIDNPTVNAGKFIFLAYTGTPGITITQTDVVIPQANCETRFGLSTRDGGGNPTGITVVGAKKIIGTMNPPDNTVNAFVDDTYQDNAVTPTKQWTCTQAGWNGTGGAPVYDSVWTQTIP